MGNAETQGDAEAGEAFAAFYKIVARLRAPDGCPWDREQTVTSLRGNLLEEAYELVEAIDEGESPHVREEIGDLFLVATMMAYIHEEASDFSVSDVLGSVSEKLVRRHPHVFGTAKAGTSEEVLRQWQEIKEKVEGRAKKDSVLDEVPKSLPPLERAYKMQKKAAKVGFDWKAAPDVWDKIREELSESERACEEASRGGDQAALEGEIGDLLFSVLNVSRFLGVNPSLALQRTNEKFSRRFRYVEKRMAEEGAAMGKENFARMDALWDEAKVKLGTDS
jgi:tetrapyrrole methylase family protein/MazG family protein